MDTLTGQVYQDIRKRVVSGNWLVGERLNEKELAESLHVSRTPLRRALAKIHEEGLLDYTKNFGYHVRAISVEDVLEIYKIRTALEKLAFIEAAGKMLEEDEKEIEKILRRSDEAVKNGDSEKLIHYSNMYNQYVYSRSGMTRLRVIQTNLQNYLSRFRMISFSGEENDRSKLAVEEHYAIFEAMKAKDFPKVAALIEIHLSRSRDYIVEIVREENKKMEELNN